MRTLLIAFVAVLFAAFTMPESAQAQRQQVGQATFGNLISALNNINAQVRALENATIRNVQVVNVENLLNGNNVNALNNALNRNETQILNLRNVLNNNEAFRNALQNALRDAEILTEPNVFIQDVVAVNVLSGGDVIVFHRP